MALELRAPVRWAMALRSLALQGSWNDRTLLGAGFAFALLPALRRIYAGDAAARDAAVARHAAYFNAHPYLATVALGAIARLERDAADPDAAARLKGALVGPLGTLGDRLVWARWRPLSAFLAVAAFAAGLPWWAALALFLGLYNALHLPLRLWGVELGWREGMNVGRALAASPLRRLPDRLTKPLAFGAGLALPWLLAGLLRDAELSPAWALGGLVAFAGLRWPAWTGGIATAAILGSACIVALTGAVR